MSAQVEVQPALGFVVPTPRLANPMHLFTFKSSVACQHIKGFITSLNDSIKGCKGSSPTIVRSESTNKLVAVLEELDAMVTNIPPLDIQGRFGNPAFKTWHAKFTEDASKLLKTIVPESNHSAVVELTPYLLDSFGNPIRVDYGSGHELAFVSLLCCLTLLGVFKVEDSQALVLVVFHRYLRLVRRVQTTYKLEPAGSRGAWGLDDHQFLCYLWGAAQLIGNAEDVNPNAITDESACTRLSDDYLFFGAVHHIRKVKSGPFFEHSPYLYDISAVAEWTKVNKGLRKMFDNEVLYKLPIMQHFLFGSLLSIDLPPVVRKVETRILPPNVRGPQTQMPPPTSMPQTRMPPK
eukprot:m.127148 g.127148  ORF g.127148 m.127148 type:complete len:349 (+) comp29251_c0_seq2:189-1235(+)